MIYYKNSVAKTQFPLLPGQLPFLVLRWSIFNKKSANYRELLKPHQIKTKYLLLNTKNF